MPYDLTLTLDLSSADPSALPRDAVPSLHRGLFEWLQRAEAGLGARVHAWGNIRDQPAYKPFTVSPLWMEGGSDPVADTAHFRLTLLHDDLLALLSAGAAALPFVEVNYVRLPLREGPRMVRHVRYADLWKQAHTGQAGHRRFQFALDTPTSFHAKKQNNPLPDPARVFEGYGLKWNTFSDVEGVDAGWLKGWVEGHVAPTAFALRSAKRIIPQPRGRGEWIGAVGEIEFSVTGRPMTVEDQAALMWLNCLAAFAPLCGTGRWCAQGMGQTRYLNAGR